MTGKLTGQVALVTGADGGIGRAVARRLADDGAMVVAGVRRPKAATDLRERYDVIELDVGQADALVLAVATRR